MQKVAVAQALVPALARFEESLGIKYEKEYPRNIGRPLKLTDNGKPLEFLL